MTDNPFDLWSRMMRSWLSPPIAAPNSLTQSILPMSLLTINEGNSGSPETEAAVVAKASYGRQIGRLVDAVEVLIAERPATAVNATSPAAAKALDGLRDIATTVREAKLAAAVARLDAMKNDLELVRVGAPDAFADHRAALLEVLDRPVPAHAV